MHGMLSKSDTHWIIIFNFLPYDKIIFINNCGIVTSNYVLNNFLVSNKVISREQILYGGGLQKFIKNADYNKKILDFFLKILMLKSFLFYVVCSYNSKHIIIVIPPSLTSPSFFVVFKITFQVYISLNKKFNK